MYPEAVYTELRQRAERGLWLLRELLPAMAPVARFKDWTPKEQQTLGFILTATARSSESVALLVAYGQLWDAEIVVRSVAEGTLKFCYLLQDHTTLKQRHQEYTDDLFQIALFKDHKKAGELLAALPNPEGVEWKPIRDRLVSDEHLAELDTKYPASVRRSLESRWGFTGLVGHLAASGDRIFDGFRSFMHGYSNASHIHHVDYVGASIPMDRDRRSPERRNLAHLTHGYRLISEIVAMLQIRLQAGYRYVGGDATTLSEIIRKIDNFTKEGETVYQSWIKVEYPEEFGNLGEKST